VRSLPLVMNFHIRNTIARAVNVSLLLICQVTAAAAGQHQKPQAPVQVVIAPLQQGAGSQASKPGETVELSISATAYLKIDEMLIETSFLGGAEYVSGDRSWQGSAQQNQPRVLKITVRRPLHGDGKMRARVKLFRAGNMLLSKQAVYDLGSKTDGVPAKPARPSRKDAKGREIVEQ
jgi:hypothetical protein